MSENKGKRTLVCWLVVDAEIYKSYSWRIYGSLANEFSEQRAVTNQIYASVREHQDVH